MTEHEIDKVCEWFNITLYSLIIDNDGITLGTKFRQFVEGISENKEEIPPKYDAEYLQSKIDAHTKRMEEQGLTSEQMLEECRGGDLLNWQDAKRLLEAGCYVADYNSYHNKPIDDEAFFKEVLKVYNNDTHKV